MRGATQCAQRLKEFWHSLRPNLGKVSRPALGDPIKQLILGILSRDVPESKALEALDTLRGIVVDYNELRVIPPLELANLLGDYPDARRKCADLGRALNRIFALEHAVTLDRLAGLPRKDVRAFLEKIDGLEAYTLARVQLLGLQQHAIALDEAMWAYARSMQIVDARCPLAEAQAFLERQIAEEDALQFVALLRKQAWAEMGATVRRGEVQRIESKPPDRTTGHMLQAAMLGSMEPQAREALRAARDHPDAKTLESAEGRATSDQGVPEVGPQPTRSSHQAQPRSRARPVEQRARASKGSGRGGVAGTSSGKSGGKTKVRTGRGSSKSREAKATGR